MDPEEIKKIRDELLKAFSQFKDANEKRLAEIEKTGSASALTNGMVDKANAAIIEMQNKLQAAVTDIEALQNRLERPGAVGGRGWRPNDKQMSLYARWQSEISRKRVDAGSVDLDLIQNYSRAFDAWMRMGDRAPSEHLQLLNSMSSGSDADGGYWVSPDLSGRVVELLFETSDIRALAAVDSTSSDSYEGSTDLDEATSGWVGETASRPETDTPEVGEWKIPVHEQYAEPRATQRQLDDANRDVEAWLAGKAASRFARQENSAFVSGNGVLRPRGFTTYGSGTPAAGSAATWRVIKQVASGAAADVTMDGALTLLMTLKTAYRQGAVWGMNRLTEAAYRKLKTGDGQYYLQPDAKLGLISLLHGHRIVEMPDMPDVAASALPVMFGNLKEAYQIVDRLGIRTLRDPYTSKPWVKFYSTKRVGGDVVNFEALALQVISA